MNKKQSTVFAFSLITYLFFLWGFAHNLDPILIPHLKRSFTLTTTQATLVDSAVFAAYFLMAKCAQRQIPMPSYNYDNYSQYEKDMLAFEKKFKNNALFPQFVKEFGTTKFYQYAYNRCSYLSDFVNKSGVRK